MYLCSCQSLLCCLLAAAMAMMTTMGDDISLLLLYDIIVLALRGGGTPRWELIVNSTYQRNSNSSCPGGVNNSNSNK